MREELRRERLRAMGVVLWHSRERRSAALASDQFAEASPAEASPAEASPALARAADEDAFGPMYEPDAEPPPAPSFDDRGGDAPMVSSALARTDEWAAGLSGPLAGDLVELREQVRACTRCELHRSRKQTVFGVGDDSARLLILGEAPGADEDAQGEPFVGRAGKLLNAMLMGIGLAREQVYIANILKCRPPRNRDPHADEIVSCGLYLQQQIAFIAPELILAVGRVAAQNLLGVTTPIGKLRGKTYTHAASGIPVIVTYHPAYLLRSPSEKRHAWQDLKLVAARLANAQ